MEITKTEIKCSFVVIIIIKKSSDVVNKITVPLRFDIIKTKYSPQLVEWLQYTPFANVLNEKRCLNRFHSNKVNYLQPHADPLHHPVFAWQPGGPLPPVPSTKIGRYLIHKTCKRIWQYASNLVFLFCFIIKLFKYHIIH